MRLGLTLPPPRQRGGGDRGAISTCPVSPMAALRRTLRVRWVCARPLSKCVRPALHDTDAFIPGLLIGRAVGPDEAHVDFGSVERAVDYMRWAEPAVMGKSPIGLTFSVYDLAPPSNVLHYGPFAGPTEALERALEPHINSVVKIHPSTHFPLAHAYFIVNGHVPDDDARGTGTIRLVSNEAATEVLGDLRCAKSAEGMPIRLTYSRAWSSK